MKNTRYLTEAAVIAAMYAAVTIALGHFGSGLFQVRISEALTILPMFTPAAIPGLFVGCVISNIITGNGPVDVIFGSFATLLAAFLSYKMPNKYLVPLPPVVVNAIVVGFILNYVLAVPLPAAMGWVALGQIISCYGAGSILIFLLERNKDKLFNYNSK